MLGKFFFLIQGWGWWEKTEGTWGHSQNEEQADSSTPWRHWTGLIQLRSSICNL